MNFYRLLMILSPIFLVASVVIGILVTKHHNKKVQAKKEAQKLNLTEDKSNCKTQENEKEIVKTNTSQLETSKENTDDLGRVVGEGINSKKVSKETSKETNLETGLEK